MPVLLPFDTADYLEDAGRRHAAAIVALPGRFPSRRPVSRRPGRLRRGVFAAARRRRLADIRQAGRSADHRLDARLRPRRSARRQGRAGQGAGGAIPRHAPLHPRRLCALRLHALRRALCGVDPVSGLGAAGAAAGLPRGLSHRRALPESLAHRGRATGAAAHDISSEIAERPAAASPDFTYYPGGDIIARSSVRRRGGRADFAAYSQIRFPLEKAPAAVRSQSFGEEKSAGRAAASIRGGTISAKPAASRSGNAPPASDIRARTSAPRPARRTATAKAAAIRGSRPSWPSATAS